MLRSVLVLLVLLLTTVVVGLRPIGWGFVACAIGFAVWANWSFIPGISPAKTIERTCQAWLDRAQPDAELGVLDVDASGVHYYTEGRTVLLGSNSSLFDFLRPGTAAHRGTRQELRKRRCNLVSRHRLR